MFFWPSVPIYANDQLIHELGLQLGVTNLPFTGITFPAIAIGLPAGQKVISASAITLLAMLANYWESFGTGSLLPKIYLLQNTSLYPY
jgi:hypothetical protein